MTFEFSKTITFEIFENTTAKEFMRLRDVDEGLYDEMMDEAIEKALANMDLENSAGCMTFLDAQD